MSDYQKKKKEPNLPKPQTTRPCSGCGSHSHGQPGSNDRSVKCPACGKNCLNCKIPNHFARVCRQQSQSDSAQALIASVEYDQDSDTFTTKTTTLTSNEEIPAILSPSLPRHQHINPVKMSIFSDSGLSICLAGPQHITKFNLDTHDLIPSYKQVKAVGGSKLTCHGWLPMTFRIGKNTTKQPVYICDKVVRFYSGKNGCIDVNILSQVFPFPMNSSSQTMPSVATINQSVSKDPTSQVTRACPPPQPEKLPCPPLEENIPKLEQYLRDKFRDTAFNRTSPFPAMSMPPAHIHLNENAKPCACHMPIPIPFHWDVERGIMTSVLIGTPVDWCSPMVVTAKKNGKPRRTIDLQHLNSQCSRETHHCQSPFLAACQVPPITKKTILDAVDGYHAIELDAESQPLMTFIT